MFNAAAVEKVGTVKAFGGSSAPDGWLFCDGSAISRTTYAALFAVIGTTFGAGDGTTTFNIPQSCMVGNTINGDVLGNGKTLGITDGAINGGLTGYAYGSTMLNFATGAYNKNAGTTGVTVTGVTSGKTYGVVTSGESGLKSMVYPFNTPHVNAIIKY